MTLMDEPVWRDKIYSASGPLTSRRSPIPAG
jgi:hypothetical protein